MYGINPVAGALVSTTTVGATAGVVTLPDTGSFSFMFVVSAIVMTIGLVILVSTAAIKLERSLVAKLSSTK
jgi:hypothetical protein